MAKTLSLEDYEGPGKIGIFRKTIIKFGNGDLDTAQESGKHISAFLKVNKYKIDRRTQFACVRNWHFKVYERALCLWGLPEVKILRFPDTVTRLPELPMQLIRRDRMTQP